MRKAEDLTGQRFGHLTVLERVDNQVGKNGKTNVVYRCRCDCGEETVVRATALRSGATTSCGCSRKTSMQSVNLEDLTGQQFGRWTVLYRAESIVEPSGRKATMWHCRCKCGTERDVRAAVLKKGMSQSCGCLKLEHLEKTRDLTGQRFGRWTVISKAPDKMIGKTYSRRQKMWHCRCECGTEKDVSEQSLIQGKTVSCGCYRKEQIKKSVTYTNLTGTTFNHWTVLRRLDDRFYPGGGRVQMWLCRCCCGHEMAVNVNALKSGDSKSCGCQSVYSSLEEYVRDYCNLNGIEYEQHKFYPNLRSDKGRALSYDFLIKSNGRPLFLVEC